MGCFCFVFYIYLIVFGGDVIEEIVLVSFKDDINYCMECWVLKVFIKLLVIVIGGISSMLWLNVFILG